MFEMYTFSVDMEATGNRIRDMRKARGITADNLAEYMGFTTAQPIYKWQKGLCLPEIPNLIALSRLFGVSVEDIIVISEAAGSEPAAFDVYGVLNHWLSVLTYVIRYTYNAAYLYG